MGLFLSTIWDLMHKPRSDGEYLLRKLLNTLRRWIEISSHEDDDWYDRHLAYPSNQDSQSRNNITAFDRADFVEKWLFPWRDRLPYLPWWVIPKTGHTCYYCQHLFIDATAMVPDIEHYSRPLSYSEIDAAASDHCLLFSWFLRFLEPYESRLEQRSFILELIPREPYISDIWWINLASNDEDEFDYELHGELGVFVKDDDTAAAYISRRPLNTMFTTENMSHVVSIPYMLPIAQLATLNVFREADGEDFVG